VKSSTRVPVIGFIERPRDMLIRQRDYIAIRCAGATRLNSSKAGECMIRSWAHRRVVAPRRIAVPQVGGA
jgi:hypothetical protein